MQKNWVIRQDNKTVADDLCSSLGVSAATASILVARGIISSVEGGRFLSPTFNDMPDPFTMKGVNEGVDRILLARKRGEKICIYGDYDVDGISGTALLVSFLRTLEICCEFFIPDRFEDGYGLNEGSLREIASTGAALIISVDCGIVSVREAMACKEIGVDLIIVDHHTPGVEIPDAVAVINPLQPGCRYPFKKLCGAGVAFLLLLALRVKMREQGAFTSVPEPDLREWLDLVALATVADVVPLTGVNRAIVYFGLKRLEKSRRKGIAALKEAAGVSGKVSSGQVGFRLAPRLNAAGRMENALAAVELLLSDDTADCYRIASELEAANSERKSVESRMLEEAAVMVESGGYPHSRSIVLASDAWHQGVAGIVAARLAEKYYRPAVVVAIDSNGDGKGSGRSIPGFDLLAGVSSGSAYLESFGGHRHAAGLRLKIENLDAFAASLEAFACNAISDADLIPQLEIDAVVTPQEVSLQLANELLRLEPFGAGNPEPTLFMSGVEVIQRRVVGDGHLKLRLAADGFRFDAIAFRSADKDTSGLIDIAFFPEINRWNNRESLQLRIKGIRNCR